MSRQERRRPRMWVLSLGNWDQYLSAESCVAEQGPTHRNQRCYVEIRTLSHCNGRMCSNGWCAWKSPHMKPVTIHVNVWETMASLSGGLGWAIPKVSFSSIVINTLLVESSISYSNDFIYCLLHSLPSTLSDHPTLERPSSMFPKQYFVKRSWFLLRYQWILTPVSAAYIVDALLFHIEFQLLHLPGHFPPSRVWSGTGWCSGRMQGPHNMLMWDSNWPTFHKDGRMSDISLTSLSVSHGSTCSNAASSPFHTEEECPNCILTIYFLLFGVIASKHLPSPCQYSILSAPYTFFLLW